MTTPSISDEKRMEGLNAAIEQRRVNAAIKNAVRSKSHTFSWALNNEEAGPIRVYQLIMSVPGVGKVRAERIMAECGISKNRRVRGLGVNQRSKLIEILG